MDVSYRTRGGRIFNVGSYVAERVPSPVLGVYAAIKSAMAALTKALARELGPKEATANFVQPGSIDTDMFPANDPYAERRKQLMALGWYGAPADIAKRGDVPGRCEGSAHHRLDVCRRPWRRKPGP